MADPRVLRRAPQICELPGLRLLPPAARFVLRGAGTAVRGAGEALGVVIDARPCRASHARGRALLWLGPDEYLLLAADAEAAELPQKLAIALREHPHALVDVSHRQTTLEVSGPRAPATLNSGCPLDLDESVFPIDTCTRTVFAKAEIVLWRTAPDTFQLEVWRSFTDYVARFLAEVARELEASESIDQTV
jgi:sarcosine oxidase subunit gamma